MFIYELLYGYTPFRVQSGGFTAITRRISSGLFNFPFQPKVTDWAKDLIKKLLVVNPKDRLGFHKGCAEVKAHPWFKHVNFALVYPTTFDLNRLREARATFVPKASQTAKEAEQTAKDLAGTGFELPERAKLLVPQALRLLQ